MADLEDYFSIGVLESFWRDIQDYNIYNIEKEMFLGSLGVLESRACIAYKMLFKLQLGRSYTLIHPYACTGIELLSFSNISIINATLLFLADFIFIFYFYFYLIIVTVIILLSSMISLTRFHWLPDWHGESQSRHMMRSKSVLSVLRPRTP